MDNERSTEPVMWTVEEATRLLRLSRAKTHQMTQRGELPAVRFGRSVRIPVKALETWLQESTKT